MNEHTDRGPPRGCVRAGPVVDLIDARRPAPLRPFRAEGSPDRPVVL